MSFIRKQHFAAFWPYVATGMLLLMSGVDGWRPFRLLIFDHKEHVFSPKCRVNASITGDNVKFNIYVEYFINIPSLNMHTGIFFLSDNGNYDMELLNRTVDMCKFFRNKSYEPILQVIFKLVEHYLPQWFHNCPVKKGVYYLENVELNAERLPPIFPEKKGVFDAAVWNKQEKLFRVEVFFEITKKFKKS